MLLWVNVCKKEYIAHIRLKDMLWCPKGSIKWPHQRSETNIYSYKYLKHHEETKQNKFQNVDVITILQKGKPKSVPYKLIRCQVSFFNHCPLGTYFKLLNNHFSSWKALTVLTDPKILLTVNKLTDVYIWIYLDFVNLQSAFKVIQSMRLILLWIG